MTRREAFRYVVSENRAMLNEVLGNLRERAENVIVGEEHLSGNDEIFDAGEGKKWKGLGVRFVAIKRSYESEWTDKIDVEFYNKERA